MCNVQRALISAKKQINAKGGDQSSRTHADHGDGTHTLPDHEAHCHSASYITRIPTMIVLVIIKGVIPLTKGDVCREKDIILIAEMTHWT